MIFKTNTDDFGRMGLGLNNSFKGMFNGDFFKEQNLLSDNDISAIKAYNAEIDKCVTSQTAFNRTMLNTSQQAQNVVAAANGNKVALEDMTKASKAAELGMKALSIAGNMIATMVISWVLSEAISWLNDLAHAEENARKRSKELTSSYEDEKKNIDDSIAKYKELSEKLNDSSLSTSEVKSIKEQLLSVQDQLNEKYGAEATQIDLVNGKYDEQIKKLDTLAKKKAGDYVSENYKDIQADQKYVSEKVNLNKSLGFKGSQARPDDYSNAGFDLKKYLDRYDKLSAKVVNPDSQYGMTGDVNLVTNGTRQEVYDQLSQLFQDLSNDFGNSNEDVNKFKTTISGILEDSFDTDALDSANDRIKKYVQAEILSNDNASTSYNNLVDAVDNYNTSLSSGKGVDDAKQKLLEAKQAAEDSTKDITNSWKVLQDVYNSLDSEAPIELQVEFGKNVDEDLQKSYEDTINRFKNSEESSLDELTQKYDEAVAKRKELYSGENYVGNVDINNRPVVINDDGSYSTTSTSFQEKWVGDEENGHYIIAHFTPILPDGTVLDDDSLNEYIDKILNSDNPMEADKVGNGGKSIVYKVDTEINGKEIKDDNLEDAFGIADAWDVDMHNLQDKMYQDEAKIKGQITQFGNDVDGSQKIKDFFDTEGINTDEEINEFNEVTKGINDADKAIQTWNEHKKETNETSISLPDLDTLRTQINGTSDNTTNLADELQAVQDILSSTGDVSEESYSKLLKCSRKYSAAVKIENGRLVINKSRLRAVALQRARDTKATIKQVRSQKLLQYLKHSKEMGVYDTVLQETTSDTYENADALRDQITQLDLLYSQLDKTTDAFNRFKEAQSTNDKELYDQTEEAYNLMYETLNGHAKGEKFDASNISEHWGQYNTDDFMDAAYLLFSEKDYIDLTKATSIDEFESIANRAMKSLSPLMEKDNAHSVDNLFKQVEKIQAEMELSGEDVPYQDDDWWANKLGISEGMWQAAKQLGNLYDFDGYKVFKEHATDALEDVTRKTMALEDATNNYEEAQKAVVENSDHWSRKELAKAELEKKQAQEEFDNVIKRNSNKLVKNVNDNYYGTSVKNTGNLENYLGNKVANNDLIAQYRSGLERLSQLEQEASDKALELYNGNVIEANRAKKALLDNNKEYQNLKKSITAATDAYHNAVQEQQQFSDNEERLNEAAEKQALYDSYDKISEKIKSAREELKNLDPDSETYETDFANITSQIDTLNGALDNIRSEIRIDIQTNIDSTISDINNLQTKINSIDFSGGGSKGASFGSASVAQTEMQKALDQKKSQLSGLQSKAQSMGIDVTVNVDDSEAKAKIASLDSEKVGDKTFGISAIDNASGVIDSINAKKIADKSFNITANAAGAGSILGGGSGHVNGNAHFGKSFANGTIGEKKDNHNVMVSEKEPEMIVDPNTGMYTIYNSPTMLDKLPKGAIVFNGKQTKDLIKNGNTSSFGKAYVNGNVSGQARTNPTSTEVNISDVGNIFDVHTNSNPLRRFKEGLDELDKDVDEKTDEAKDKSEEVFDWIERKVKKLQRLFERWTNNAEKTFSKDLVGKYYKKASSNLTQQLDTQEKAYSRYLAEAEKSPISDDYKKKIKDGAIDIETIIEEAAEDGNKTMAEQISSYQEYYDKATDALTAFEEAAEKKFNIPIEKAAQKVELFKNSIDLLDKKIDNAIGAKAKNKLINKQLSDQKATKAAYKNAQKATTKAVKTQSKNMVSSSVLKSSDVSKAEKKSIKKSVKNGKELNLTMFTEGSKAYLQAIKYNEAIRANTQATLDYKNAVEEYTSAVREAQKTKFDNIATDFENKISLLEHKVTNIDNQISNIEARGLTAGKSYYASQKQINADQLDYYKKEKASLENYIANIEEGTEDWYDAKSKIQECANSIATCEQNVYKLNDSIRNVDITKFELIEKQISAISDEADFLNGLIGNNPLFDEDKVMTNAGLATLGNYAAQYYSSKSNASNDKAEIERLQKILNDGTWASDSFDSAQQVEDRISELYGTWQGHINDLNSAQKSIYDLMNQELDNQLDKIKELIEAKKEELEAEKDLHDYNNTISEKTKDIATLQKQIAAYSGNTSQEGQAKLQKLQASLNDKQKDLRDTEYDKYISDQEDILDRLLKELEEANKKQLNDFMELVQKGLNLANSNIDTVNKTIQEYSELYGYKPQYLDTAFSGKEGSIQEKIDEVITAIKAKANESVVEPISETPTVAKVPENAKNTNGTPKNDGISQPVVGGNNNHAAAMLDKVTTDESKKTTTATNYINKNAKKRKDKKSDIKYDVNKRLWDVNSKKTLTTAQLKELAKKLGVKDTKFDKSGALYKKLHSLKVLGFANGGIVRDELEGKIKKNGDSLLASINPNETVLTEKFTNLMPDAVDMMSKFVKVDLPYVSKFITPISQPTTIDSHIDINLPNVENGVDFIAELKKPKVQKALQSVTTDLLAGGSKLGINRFK